MEKFIVRTSDRIRFKKCRRQWDLMSPLRKHYEPMVAPKPLEFGIAIHEALEVYYEPELWDLPDREPVELATLQTFRDSCEKQKKLHLQARGSDNLADDIEEDFQERIELGIGILRNYFLWAPGVDKFKPIMAEIEFEVNIPMYGDVTEQVHFVYQGRLDLIIEDEDGLLWIVDHKTTTQFGDTTYLELDEQVTSYAWAIEKMLGIHIEGIIFSQLRKKVPKYPDLLQAGGLSKNKQQDTTYNTYTQAMKDRGIRVDDPAYAEFLLFLKYKPNNFFRRIQIQRNRHELQEIENRISSEAKDMYDFPAIYANPSWMGCNGCAVRDVCIAMNDGSDAQWILDNQFKKGDDDDDV